MLPTKSASRARAGASETQTEAIGCRPARGQSPYVVFVRSHNHGDTPVHTMVPFRIWTVPRTVQDLDWHCLVRRGGLGDRAGELCTELCWWITTLLFAP